MCGEKATRIAPKNCGSGSPPHMRGKDKLAIFEGIVNGITPAYAGKSRSRHVCISRRRDHPRVCGEKRTARPDHDRGLGSPPRMRGKEIELCESQTIDRITPAYAGKSLSWRCWVEYIWDHPRVCGEKAVIELVACVELGSPPRMRGKVLFFHIRIAVEGITPAYAGKRLKRSRSTVPHAAIVPLFPSVCNKPAGSDGSPAGHDAPPFLPIENAAPASPAYNLRSL